MWIPTSCCTSGAEQKLVDKGNPGFCCRGSMPFRGAIAAQSAGCSMSARHDGASRLPDAHAVLCARVRLQCDLYESCGHQCPASIAIISFSRITTPWKRRTPEEISETHYPIWHGTAGNRRIPDFREWMRNPAATDL